MVAMLVIVIVDSRDCYFFFNDTATTEIYTLSLHDALPIWDCGPRSCSVSRHSKESRAGCSVGKRSRRVRRPTAISVRASRSEEHTSELQSRQYLVCRLLLEKKKNQSCTFM